MEKTIILLFCADDFEREELDKMSSNERYELANEKYCDIFTLQEFCELANSGSDWLILNNFIYPHIINN
jgi:hypothetical protein